MITAEEARKNVDNYEGSIALTLRSIERASKIGKRSVAYQTPRTNAAKFLMKELEKLGFILTFEINGSLYNWTINW